ncbi:MAG TPA: FAD:protein FMN transferase [Longimicrobiaceae bacterium]
MLLSCVSFAASPRRFEYRQIHMGVEARLVFYTADSTRALSAARAAFERIAELDAIMSDYRDDSELMRLVGQPAGSWVPVSEPLWRVLQVAQELARQSDGAFDVTVGPLIQLWREARRARVLPTASELEEARRRTGWHLLELDPERRAVRLARPGMRLDLGGIAKGYAADEALAVLREHGIERALVEFGGDIVVGAPPPGERAWTIRLDDPAGAPPVVPLAHGAISTSGDAVQYVEIGGVRYSHVIDPRTGTPLRGHSAATVITRSGLYSDPLSTLAGVLGEEAGGAFLQRNYPEVTFYIRRLGPTADLR